MPEDPDPDDFHGIDKSEEQSEETEDKGGFASVKRKLSGGLDRTRGAIASAAPGYGNTDNDDVDEGRRKFLEGAAVATGVIGVGAVSADYLSDGDVDGNLEGRGGPLAGLADGRNRTQQTPTDPDPRDRTTDDPTTEYTEEQPGGANTDQPGTDTPGDTPAETTDTPTDTATESPGQTTTESQGYTGEIDGRNYSLETIPGPVEGQGYLVDDDVLSQFDSDAWDDIIDEEEYQEELGTGTDWYLTQDSIVGINERKMVSRTFPSDRFNYDTEGLYQEIAEDK